MRTTLDIDDDVLSAVKEIARIKGRSMGTVVSDLARQALTQVAESGTRNGVPLFPQSPGGGLVTSALVYELLDEGP